MPRDHYRILVEGDGQHHEGSTEDADQIARKLVRDLVGAGHRVAKASFTPSIGKTPDTLGLAAKQPEQLAGQPQGLGEAREPLHGLPAPEEEGDLEALSKDELVERSLALGLDVKRSGGGEGEPLKEDYVKALKKAEKVR